MILIVCALGITQDASVRNAHNYGCMIVNELLQFIRQVFEMCNELFSTALV